MVNQSCIVLFDLPFPFIFLIFYDICHLWQNISSCLTIRISFYKSIWSNHNVTRSKRNIVLQPISTILHTDLTLNTWCLIERLVGISHRGTFGYSICWSVVGSFTMKILFIIHWFHLSLVQLHRKFMFDLNMYLTTST